MDVENLIALIHERRSLWDINDKLYHNREISRKLWGEIASALSCTSALAKTKWQNLRDTYRREMTKSKTPSGPTGETFQSKWVYFELMNFLEEIYLGRKSQNESIKIEDYFSEMGTSRDASGCETGLASDVEEHSESNDSDYTPSSTALANTSQSLYETKSISAKKRPRHLKNPVCELVELEKDNVPHNTRELPKNNQNRLDEIVNDEDYFFLMSLLPHVRAISRQRILGVRCELQQVLMRHAEQE